MPISAISSAYSGIQAANASLQKTTADIVKATTQDAQPVSAPSQTVTSTPTTQSSDNQAPQGASLERSLVQLTSDKLQAGANAKSMQTAFDTLGTIIDIKA